MAILDLTNDEVTVAVANWYDHADNCGFTIDENLPIGEYAWAEMVATAENEGYCIEDMSALIGWLVENAGDEMVDGYMIKWAIGYAIKNDLPTDFSIL